MTARAPAVDRAALVRRALLELVAERGFRGTNMASVAERAGVATGTIYVHYGSKEELISAVYREVKHELGSVAVADVDEADPPENRFRALWLAAYEHLAADPVRARFLVQVDGSPVAERIRQDHASDTEDPLVAAAAAPDMVDVLLDLPAELLYELGLAPAVRLAAATAVPVDAGMLEKIAAACWRAVTVPESSDSASGE